MFSSRRSSRPNRQTPEPDGYDEEDFAGDHSHQAGQEKTKQLLLDLLGRWHWITFGLILGILAGVYYLSKAPRIYQARSTLLVKQQASQVMKSGDQMDEVDLRSGEGMKTIVDRMTQPELFEKVAALPEVRDLPGLIPQPVVWLPEWSLNWLGKAPASLAAQESPPAPAALAHSIAFWTSVSIRRGSRLLDLTVSHPSPEVATAIANAIGNTYQAELTDARSNGRGSSLKILVEESEAARARLQTAQNAMAIYQRALITLKDMETHEVAAAELSRRYLPKHPRLIAAMAELQSLRQRFLAEFDAARTSSADREYWDAHAAEWLESNTEEGTRLLTARRLLLARGNVLESEIQSQTSVFNSMLTRIQEADINQQAVESEVEVISTARASHLPVSPVSRKVLAMAAFGGLLFGGLLALLFVRLDNKLHDITQLERETGAPVLGAICQLHPSILSKTASLHVPKNRVVLPSDLPAARQRWNPMLLFREGLLTTTFAERFRVLRASVLLLGDEKKRRITLFSSALPGEGKTFVSSNFALAAACHGKRTLLIDLDLRKPSVHKIFGLHRDSHPCGAAEVLAGQAAFEDAILTDTGAEHLHIMLAGKRAPNPGELLNTANLREFLQTAAQAYDLVVIDSAPLLAVPDTRLIASLVDNFCLVVRADYAPKGAVRSVISLLHGDDNLPCGLVFNGFAEKRRLFGRDASHLDYQSNRYGKSYRYGYGSYGTYGSEDAA